MFSGEKILHRGDSVKRKEVTKENDPSDSSDIKRHQKNEIGTNPNILSFIIIIIIIIIFVRGVELIITSFAN